MFWKAKFMTNVQRMKHDINILILVTLRRTSKGMKDTKSDWDVSNFSYVKYKPKELFILNLKLTLKIKRTLKKS